MQIPDLPLENNQAQIGDGAGDFHMSDETANFIAAQSDG
jgi:hypothetical protein